MNVAAVFAQLSLVSFPGRALLGSAWISQWREFWKNQIFFVKGRCVYVCAGTSFKCELEGKFSANADPLPQSHLF